MLAGQELYHQPTAIPPPTIFTSYDSRNLGKESALCHPGQLHLKMGVEMFAVLMNSEENVKVLSTDSLLSGICTMRVNNKSYWCCFSS